MSDIVERLRGHFAENPNTPALTAEDCEEAATEIETLRAAYRTMRSYANHRDLCATRRFMENPCDCGFDDLFRAADDPRQGFRLT